MPHILPLFDSGETEGFPFYVMISRDDQRMQRVVSSGTDGPLIMVENWLEEVKQRIGR